MKIKQLIKKLEESMAMRGDNMCEKCNSTGWVCENHCNKPWETGFGNDCECGGAGMPCECNPRALMPPGTEIIFARDDAETEEYKPKLDA